MPGARVRLELDASLSRFSRRPLRHEPSLRTQSTTLKKKSASERAHSAHKDNDSQRKRKGKVTSALSRACFSFPVLLLPSLLSPSPSPPSPLSLTRMATSSYPLEKAFYLSLPSSSARSSYTRKRNAASKAFRCSHPESDEREAREEGWRAAGWRGPWYEDLEGTGLGGGGGVGRDGEEEEGEGGEEGTRSWLVGLNPKQRKGE